MAGIIGTLIAVLGLGMSSAQAGVSERDWGRTADEGRPARLYTLTNASGMEVAITNYGATIATEFRFLMEQR
jgi:hypothetical protein